MPEERYEAVIFDMDGVLADSEPVYYEAIRSVLSPLGKEFTEQMQRTMMGHGVAETWDQLARELDLTGPLDDLVDAYDRELCRQLALIHEPLPGVRELLAQIKRRGLPVGLASSSWPGWIEALLGGTGLAGAFDAVISASEVAQGKPAPDVYLLAAQRIGVEPARCIAVEDTPTGLAAAKAAGMLTIQVRSASTAFPPLEDADLVLDTLKTFDLTLLADD